MRRLQAERNNVWGPKFGSGSGLGQVSVGRLQAERNVVSGLKFGSGSGLGQVSCCCCYCNRAGKSFGVGVRLLEITY